MSESYFIHLDYQSGDTNETYDTSMDLAFEWKDKSKAKAALKRIQEHYEWLKCDKRNRSHCYRHWNSECPEEPAWHKETPAGMPNWLTGSSKEYALWFEMDDGSLAFTTAYEWAGYFERLHGGMIMIKPEEGMSFTS